MNTPFEANPTALNRQPQRARSRTRLVHWRQQAMMFALLLMFGYILMSHIQSVDATNTHVGLTDLYKTRQAELQQYEQQNLKLQQENARLLEAKAQMIGSLLTNSGNGDLLAQLDRNKMLSGMAEVRGPGISFTLTDKPTYNILTDPLDAIVHDADMRYAFKILVENGATAISVNGMRFVNTTSIRCIGPTILVNDSRLAPPYVITATGDQQRLYHAVATDPYFALRTQAPTGIVAQAKLLDSVTLPPFHDADQLEKYINLLEVPKS